MRENAIGCGHVGRYGRKAEIADVIIAPSHRGQGCGKFLVQSLIQIAHNNRWHPLEICVLADNKVAIHLYQRLGFQQTGTIILTDQSLALVLSHK